MGYCMSQNECDFFIPVDKTKDALGAIKDLAGKETIKYGHSAPHFSWVETKDFLNASNLKEALDVWGWSAEEDEDGNIANILFEREKIGDEDILFNAIAPYVKSGSYIEMLGEDGGLWRWIFNEDRCITKDAKISWE